MLSLLFAAVATFSFGDVELNSPNPGDWKFSITREVAPDGAEIAKIVLEASAPAVPPPFNVSFRLPQVDMTYRWMVNGNDFVLPPDWSGADGSAFAQSLPVYVFFNGKNESGLAVAASECDRPLMFTGAVREEGSLLVCKFEYFTVPEAPLTKYETRIRINATRRNFCDAVRQSVAWVEKAGGYTPCVAPEAAFDPLYSSWYNFHQNLFAKDVEAECAIAAKLGMKTVIIDDGWQTDDTNRGYAFCGDWQVSTNRFPDMRAHVKRVQEMGLKYMVWYSVPFIGTKSTNYARFKGKYLKDGVLGAAVLDPRFPEVRAFLVGTYVKAMKEWGIDGFKLDFIDSFRFYGDDPAVKENYAGRDMKSLPLAVNHLMREIHDALTAINPDVLLEFRQSYIGPGVRQYGNMLRVGDCPGRMRRNRVAIANLRLASGKSAVHADMLEWNFAEKPEDAALFIMNAMFGVVQYSVMLRDAPATHRTMIEKWIKFSQEHRDTLLKGSFTPHHPELMYPIIEAESASERIIGVYGACCVAEIPDDKKTILMNATGKDALTVRRQGKLMDVPCKSGDWIEVK